MSEGFGIMVCGHGSRDENAVAEFAAVATAMRERFTDREVEYGFLEFAQPSTASAAASPTATTAPRTARVAAARRARLSRRSSHPVSAPISDTG